MTKQEAIAEINHMIDKTKGRWHSDPVSMAASYAESQALKECLEIVQQIDSINGDQEEREGT